MPSSSPSTPEMPRTALLSVVLGLLIGGAVASHQAQLPGSTVHTWVTDAAPPTPSANVPVTADSISDAEAQAVMARLYRLQSERMEALQRDDTRATTRLLEASLHTAASYVKRPGFTARRDAEALVRTLRYAYETHHGVPDTLGLPEGDIYPLRAALFDTLNHQEPGPMPQVDDALPAGIEETRTEVPIVVNNRVRQSVAFLLRNARLHLYPWMRRSDTYFPMIEQIFAEEGVPDELKYLALVESGMNPFAYSHARAAGLWQFVPATARQYGLTIDPWVDERRDPEKSTRAAARLLRDLYAFFGDWHLALAGYNFRPSRVKQAARRAEQRLGRPATFWDIYDDLPDETRNYVPSFMATALILSDPGAFDLARVPTGPRYAFDHVPVRHVLTLDQIASWVGEPHDQIKALNPELRSDRLPASTTPYYVRIPYGSFSAFAEAYDAYAEDEARLGSQSSVVVQAGDTVGRLAQRHQVSPEALPFRLMSAVQVGTPVPVPPNTYTGNVALLAEAGMQPVRVQYSARATRGLLAEDAPSRFETDLPGADEASPPDLQ